MTVRVSGWNALPLQVTRTRARVAAEARAPAASFEALEAETAQSSQTRSAWTSLTLETDCQAVFQRSTLAEHKGARLACPPAGVLQDAEPRVSKAPCSNAPERSWNM